jgi:hypothetical protein
MEWRKVLISNDSFFNSLHGGQISCTFCHGGNGSASDQATAHVNMVRDPSNKCGGCHSGASATDSTNLHSNMNGMVSALKARGGDLSAGSALEKGFQTNCNTCHTSCGQCHISRADNFEGGLIDNHNVLATPSFDSTCFACHGSRPGPEFVGNVEITPDSGVYTPADVHSTLSMTCTSCHTEAEMHGTGNTTAPANMYNDPDAVSCLDCHADLKTPENLAKNTQHSRHLGTLACYVCHSVQYKSCYNCHVGVDNVGLPYHQSDPSTIGFEIGLNPNPTAQHPEKYVVLRHVPVVADTFVYYGDNLLPNYNSVPDWKMATPHNIQLDTPQNASCNSCHGHSEYFLISSDIAKDAPTADSKVVVTAIPPKLPGLK